MKTKAFMVVLALMLLCPAIAQAAEKVKVAVFPFDVFSREPLPDMRQRLQDLLRGKLEAEGVVALPRETVNQELLKAKKPLDLSLARRLAGRLGANYAIYGSLTKIGSRVSLDAKLMDSLGMTRPQSVFVEGVGLDELSSMADRLARDLAARMTGLERVAAIKVTGNKRIEADAVTAVMKTKTGGPYSPVRLDQDLRAIWKMGYFADVRIKTSDSEKGKVVTVQVKEKPQVREVRISGAKAIDDKDIRDQIAVKPFSVFKPETVKESEAKIVKLYHDKGFYDVKVTSDVVNLANGDKGVTFKIKEGNKVFIKAIRFRGNKAFSDGDLRSQMSTEQEGWLTWITDANVLDRTKLDQDKERLTDYYYNHGYMTARVSEPEISREPGGLVVTFDIVEGSRFKVSSISISGEMIVPQKELLPKLKTKPGEWFSREALRSDLRQINDLYADRGFAYVEVRPRIKEDRKKHQVSINLSVKKGEKVYLERIVITGNTRTRDNVIRRELGVAEGDLFSSAALRNANMRLHRLNFFEDVHLSTAKGSAPNLMDLKINVKEKRTGSFSVGAGYSTIDRIMLMGSITEANLMGRGQLLQLQGQVGGLSTRYTLSFTEPWLFDHPISAGFDLYNWYREYPNYNKDATGINIRFGWPTWWKATRLYTYYKYEEAEVSNVSNTASRLIRDQVGTHTTSSLRAILKRDTRNHNFNPSSGSENSISVEYAGGPLGGTNEFTKAIGETGWYFPLWWGHVGVLHGRIGWLEGSSVPIYEKFFLGGINTLRGFDYNSVGPKDEGDVVGGERMIQINVEYRFPLVSKAGLVGVLFYDTGNAWTASDGYQIGDLRKSAGVGVRWLSPIGPLRLEYGWVLDPKEGESNSNWEFSIGSLF